MLDRLVKAEAINDARAVVRTQSVDAPRDHFLLLRKVRHHRSLRGYRAPTDTRELHFAFAVGGLEKTGNQSIETATTDTTKCSRSRELWPGNPGDRVRTI